FLPVTESLRAGHDARLKTPLFGRLDERRRLTRRLQAVRDTGASQLVWIEGEPGIGESRLLAFFFDHARDEGFRISYAAGDRIARDVLYYPWKRIFSDLFAADGMTITDQHLRIVSLLKHRPLLMSWVPLLETFLPLGLEENEITSQMA